MIYILLPAYNEASDINFLVDKIHVYFTEVLDQSYHIIACNDGSTDNTLCKLEAFQGKALPITMYVFNPSGLM